MLWQSVEQALRLINQKPQIYNPVEFLQNVQKALNVLNWSVYVDSIQIGESV